MFLKKAHKASTFNRQHLPSMADAELLAAIEPHTYNEIFNEIFNRYSHILYGVCMTYLKDTEESKDAVQSIFEKIFVDLNNHNVSNLKSWLFIVAKNYSLMQLRRRQLEVKGLADETSTQILYHLYEQEMATKNSEEITQRQLAQMVAHMEQLSSQQSICLSLMYLDNKSYREIADVTGFELNEVKSYIQNGKRNLRKLLTNGHEH